MNLVLSSECPEQRRCLSVGVAQITIWIHYFSARKGSVELIPC